MAEDFDSPWKEALERFIEPFFEFFFPAAHAGIAWQRPVRHLDSELRKVVRDAEQPNRRADHLVQVERQEGEPHLVLVHIEVQSQYDRDLDKRMFTTLYRVYDRFDLPVLGIAVLGAQREGWDPSRFGWKIWGVGVEARFRTVQLLDYNGRWPELERSANPFALVAQAYLKTRETRGAAQARRAWKLRLIRSLYERDFRSEDVLELFRIIDWMMALPENVDRLFQDDLKQMEEELSMPYVTSVERLARKDGLQEGLGILSRVLTNQLTGKFGELPSTVVTRLKTASGPELESWGERLLTAESLDEIFDS